MAQLTLAVSGHAFSRAEQESTAACVASVKMQYVTSDLKCGGDCTVAQTHCDVFLDDLFFQHFL